ncbi:unnamed protein product, partial [Meganyctiphanes norvegica]
YEEFDHHHDGGVTQVRICHDGGENGLHSFHRLNGSHSPRATDEASEASSRCTLKRELPAIPLSADAEGGGPTECTVERTQSQHSSDLYAAVGEGSEGGSGVKNYGGILVLPTGAIGQGGRAAVIREERSPILEKDVRRETERQEASASVTSPTGVSHPYAKVKKNHPYAQVKLPKKEHPYAKVMTKDDLEDPETDTDNYDDPGTIKKEKSWEGEAVYEPAPPVPEKRFDLEEEDSTGKSGDQLEANLSATSPHSPLLSTSRSALTTSGTSPTSPHSGGAPTTATTTTSAGDRSPSAEIPAAMAMSGHIPANEELPYMTPPLHHAGLPGDVSQSGGSAAQQQQQQQQQQHFSGDSQDSRGYTSITVREPLANIKAQTQAAQAAAAAARQTNVEGEGYYMTVSDDSADEMYACIYEGGRGGGSETYAQIEPRGSSPPAPPSVPSPPHPSTPSPLTTRGGSQPPPAPPSVDSLRHVVHSRQASGSSAASVMGSPGAEKRGTRSPLPPLPQGDASMYSAPTAPQPPQPPHSPPKAANPPVERPTQRALEEMYAKVMKKQRGGHSRDNSGGGTESDTCSQSSSRRGSVDISGQRFSQYTSTPPSTPRQSLDMSGMTHSLIETRNMEVVIPPVSRAKSYEATGASWGASTTISGGTPASVGQMTQQPTSIPNYESISQHSSTFYGTGSSDPGYETVKNSEPPYASVERPEVNYPGYETVKTSDVDSEPGYETLKHREYEPGYETVAVEGRRGTQEVPSEPGYETVSHDQRQVYEPGYEIVTHPSAKRQTTDPGYESVKDKPSSEYDPGYEELHSSGIHHARSTSENDPNYEQLKFTTSRRSSEGDSEPGYETVKKQESESNYECMRDYDTQENYPMYEKIDKNSQEKSQTTPEASSEIPMYAKVNKGNKSPEKKLSPEKSQQQIDDDRADADSAVSPGSIMESSMETVMARSSHGIMESSVESKTETGSEKSGKHASDDESPASPPARSPVMQLPPCLLGSPETERQAASKQPMKPPQHQHSISSDESPTDNSSRESSPIVESRPVIGGLEKSSPSKEQQKSPIITSVSPPPPLVAEIPSPTRGFPPANVSLDNDDSPPLSPVKQPPSPVFPVKQTQQQPPTSSSPPPPPPLIPETVAPPPPLIPETVAPPPLISETVEPPSPLISETVAPPPPLISETVAPPPPLISETVAPPPPLISETVAPPPPLISETVAPPPPPLISETVEEAAAPPPPVLTDSSPTEMKEETSKSPSERSSSVLDSPERLPSPPPLTDPTRNDDTSPVSPLMAAVEMPGVATSPSTGKEITVKGSNLIQDKPVSSLIDTIAQAKDDEDDQEDESQKSMKSESSSESESSETTEGEDDDDESESEEHLPPPPVETAAESDTITVNQLPDDLLPPPLPAEDSEISPVNDIRPCGIPQTPSLTFTDTLGQELNLLDSFEAADPPAVSEGTESGTCGAGVTEDQDDLPPPPPPPVLPDEDHMDSSVASGYDHNTPDPPSEFTTNGMTVTVNPMAEMDDDAPLDGVLPPPLPPIVSSGQSGGVSSNNNNNNSGSSSGSVGPSGDSSADTTGGSGDSVESVVTVESTGETTTITTTGSAITATSPTTTTRQASHESSSTDTPLSDPNEQITPV